MACLNYKLRVSRNYSQSNPNRYQNMGGARGWKHGFADFHLRALSSQLSSIVFNSNLRKMADNQRIRAPTRIYVVIIVGFRSRPTTHHCLVPTNPPPLLSPILGDLLRSVLFVTVWHRKMWFWFLESGAKSLKLWLVNVQTITKNMPGHLPGVPVQK